MQKTRIITNIRNRELHNLCEKGLQKDSPETHRKYLERWHERDNREKRESELSIRIKKMKQGEAQRFIQDYVLPDIYQSVATIQLNQALDDKEIKVRVGASDHPYDDTVALARAVAEILIEEGLSVAIESKGFFYHSSDLEPHDGDDYYLIIKW